LISTVKSCPRDITEPEPDMDDDYVIITEPKSGTKASDITESEPDMADDYVVIDPDDAWKIASDYEWEADEPEEEYVQVMVRSTQQQDSQLPPHLRHVKKRLSSHTLETIEKMHLSPESYNLCLQLIHFSSRNEATLVSPVSSTNSKTDDIFTVYAKLYRRWEKSEEAWKIDRIMEAYEGEVIDHADIPIEHSMESESTHMHNPNSTATSANDHSSRSLP